LVLESLYFTLCIITIIIIIIIIIIRITIFVIKPEMELRYELDSRQILVRFPTDLRDLTLLQPIPTSSAAHPVPYSTGIGESFPTGKGMGVKIE
jgi:hypothetical protein